VSVVPSTLTLATGASAQFLATLHGDLNGFIRWEVNRIPGGNSEVGRIDESGLYQAPAAVPSDSVTITAVLSADTRRFGVANVTVVEPITIQPARAALVLSQTIQFQATTLEDVNVDWAASGGTVTAAGLYTAPEEAGLYTVSAVSRADPAIRTEATVYVTDLAGVFSWRNDTGLTGQNRQELALSPATVGPDSFGKIASCPVDGQVYAQPLYVAGLVIGGRARNLVFVATQHDSLYAFDADSTSCEQIWKRSFLDEVAGATPIPAIDLPSADIAPEVGITGTPVIDPASKTLYLVARTKEATGPSYVQKLHALDLATGNEKPGSAVKISASVPGTGDGSTGSGPDAQVALDPLIANQRAGLQLVGGRVYIAFDGHGQTTFGHGWLLVYDATTLQQVAVFNTTPDRSLGGIGATPSADDAGNFYLATGRGAFDLTLPTHLKRSVGQTLLKLLPSPLTITDFFTPIDHVSLTLNQHDFGRNGVVVLPSQAGGIDKPLAVVGGGQGTLYLIDRSDMGGLTEGSGVDDVITTVPLFRPLHTTPAYWQDTLYVAATNDVLKAFSLAGGTLAGAPHQQSNTNFGAGGASLSISSHGPNGGIVWALDTSDSSEPAVLRAYDASDLSRELYSSAAKTSDAAGLATSGAVPTVANGRVYAGTQNDLTIYSLLP
jgi:hypothetical protein